MSTPNHHDTAPADPPHPYALVTGSGRGIGAATATALVARGWPVCVNYARNADTAERLVARLRADGGRAIAVQADVANDRDIERLFATADRELGQLGALINNAGILDRLARLEDMSPARIRRMFEVNAIGTMLCAREAVRRMLPARGGVIVNVSSIAARLGSPGEFVDYAATKGAVDTFTTGLAREVAADGIRVNAVRPGLIDTEMHADSGLPDRPARLAHAIPAKRAGTAAEVAATIAWLVCDAPTYVTGTFLDVAGGR